MFIGFSFEKTLHRFLEATFNNIFLEGRKKVVESKTTLTFQFYNFTIFKKSKSGKSVFILY